MNAEQINIEEEEDGFYVWFKFEEGELAIRIQDVAEQLYTQARFRIGPWLRERDEARGTRIVNTGAGIQVFGCDPDESGGYDISDPKHPDHHSVHADIWDAREGK